MVRAVQGNLGAVLLGIWCVCGGVEKGFIERVTFNRRLMGGWDLAGPGGRGTGREYGGCKGFWG